MPHPRSGSRETIVQDVVPLRALQRPPAWFCLPRLTSATQAYGCACPETPAGRRARSWRNVTTHLTPLIPLIVRVRFGPRDCEQRSSTSPHPVPPCTCSSPPSPRTSNHPSCPLICRLICALAHTSIERSTARPTPERTSPRSPCSSPRVSAHPRRSRGPSAARLTAFGSPLDTPVLHLHAGTGPRPPTHL